MALIGPRGHVAERLAAFAAAGVTTLNVTPLGGRPPSGWRRWRRSSSSPMRGDVAGRSAHGPGGSPVTAQLAAVYRMVMPGRTTHADSS